MRSAAGVRIVGVRIVAAMLLCSALHAIAASPETEARLKALQFALAQADQAQQSVHMRFQMLVEIRRAESDQFRVLMPEAGVASPPRNYDDLARQRSENEQRAKYHSDELTRLYARFDEIERDKDRLRDEIRRLMESN